MRASDLPMFLYGAETRDAPIDRPVIGIGRISRMTGPGSVTGRSVSRLADSTLILYNSISINKKLAKTCF